MHITGIANSAKDRQRSPCRGWRLEDKALHSPLPQSLGGAPCRFPEPSAPDSGVWGGAQKSAILEHSWGYILTAARLGNWPEEYAEMILRCPETGLRSCHCVLLLIIKAAQGCFVHKESKIQNEPFPGGMKTSIAWFLEQVAVPKFPDMLRMPCRLPFLHSNLGHRLGEGP